MTDHIAAMRQALEAPGCERLKDFYSVGPVQRAAVESFADALDAALAKVQEPVATAWMKDGEMVNAFPHPPRESEQDIQYWLSRGYTEQPLYAAPPAPAATVLTDADIVAIMRDGNNCNYNDEGEHIDFARAAIAEFCRINNIK